MTSTKTIALPMLALVQYSMNALSHADRERGDDRAAQLAEAAEDDDQEGVDDVVGPERRADRPEQRRAHAGDAGQAGAEEERQPVDAAVGDAERGGERRGSA